MPRNYRRATAMSDDDTTRSFEDVREEVASDGENKIPDASDLSIPSSVDPNYDERKHTTGTIDGYGFSLRVDGDAPDELVADIEAALADVKAEVGRDE
jgi:hypothetical protein